MAIVVEHDKRKQEILQKSLDVFIEEGYEDATFQKIADRCGITRTTLYIYFKNKHEIFLGSIKELLSEVEIALKEIIKNDKLSAEDALRQILTTLTDAC
jgi:AcrR family transcriptional regulator